MTCGYEDYVPSGLALPSSAVGIFVNGRSCEERSKAIREMGYKLFIVLAIG
jgi:hypothetical protein